MAALQSRELKWEGHHTFLYSQLQFMLEKESYVDVILANTEGQSIKVHRLVLCAASPFFKDLLSQHNPAEETTTITLQDVSYVILKTLVKFIYKGEITVNSKAQLSLFLETALALQIKGLMENSLPSKGSHQKEEEEFESEPQREIPVEIKADSSIIVVFDDDVGEVQEEREPSESDEDEERQEIVADELLYISEHSSLEDFNSSPDESSDDEAAAGPLGSKRKATMTSPQTSNQHSNKKRGKNQQSISQRTTASAADPNRPFECSTCGRSYKRKYHLTRHSATHECVKVVTPNQPYECIKCGRCYKRKDHLVRHSAHECVGIDPSFACSKCHYRARRKYHLSRHLKEFHRITRQTEIATAAATSGTMFSL